MIVEKPVVKTLVSETEWDVEHCHYCMKRINRGIPCKSCVFVSKLKFIPDMSLWSVDDSCVD